MIISEHGFNASCGHYAENNDSKSSTQNKGRIPTMASKYLKWRNLYQMLFFIIIVICFFILQRLFFLVIIANELNVH